MWKRARELANLIYSFSEIGIFAKDYGMRDQINEVIAPAETCSNQLARFMQYLESKPNARRIRDEGAAYDL